MKLRKSVQPKVIHNSTSSWSAPIIVVPKGDGGKQLVMDYHALNKVTRKFTWPMPKGEGIFSKLNGVKYFYFGFRKWLSSYNSIQIFHTKTTFNSPSGKYENIKVPFGLAQAPAYFQELKTGILKDFDFAIAY